METVRKTRKLPEQVADKLREMIIQESLKTGAKLPAEAELMERFGVSRSTVREAVKNFADGAYRRYPAGAGHVFVRHAGAGERPAGGCASPIRRS